MSSSRKIPVITALEQRIRVATANPNHNTSCDLVELLGDTMELLLSSVLEKLQNKQFTDETMEAVVGNVVPEAIAQVLEVEDVGSKSTENLNRLIVKHVMEKMKSNFYSSKDPAVNDKQQITDMYRINVVAQEATDVKKELIFRVCTPHLETKKIAIVNPLPLYKEGVSSVDSRRTQETRSVKGPQTDRLEENCSGHHGADEALSDSGQDCASSAEITEDTTAEVPEPEQTALLATSKQEGNQQETEEVKERKMAVKALISDLIWQIAEKSGQSYPKEQCDAICEHLFLKLWAQVEDRLSSLSPEKIKSLDKLIFTDLCKKWDKLENLLNYLGRPLIDKTILSCIKNRLLNQSKMLGLVKNLFNEIQTLLKDSLPLHCFTLCCR
ncbi:hypothetical protein GOODEAATRI_029653 [Goodea atripinnis]|uniref:Uncharacterized protein n=1 Tax=Goodea atripinnis TaxID=208336 RepID=A0ABV0PI56_9TELE